MAKPVQYSEGGVGGVGRVGGLLLGHARRVPLCGWSTSRLLTFLMDSHTQQTKAAVVSALNFKFYLSH